MVVNLITYETALLAKEKGFDELCRHGYTILEDGHPQMGEIRNFSDAYSTMPLCKNSNLTQMVTAPTQALLQKWLREVYNIELGVLRYTYSGGIYQGRKYMYYVDQYDPKYNHELAADDSHWILNEREANGYEFSDYEAALEEAIKIALNLIKL